VAGRARRKGVYAPLSAQYYLDDAILEAGPDAELLWVRILSFLASIPSDGYVSERQLRSVGLGLRSVPVRVRKLQEVGLLIAEPGGFVARSWLKWNKSVQEYDKELSTDRARHAQKSGEVDPISERNPTGVLTDSDAQSSTEQSSTEQNTSLSDADASNAGDLIPDGWGPNQKHVDLAASLGLDVRREEERFRHHANRIKRRLKNWNTGFTNWLKQGAVMAQQRQGAPVAARPAKADVNFAEYQRLYGGNDGRAGSVPALDPGVG